MERTDPIRVLVVEDDADIGELLELVLRRRGMHVRAAPDGRTALDLASVLRPEVALIDLWLPDMDGVAVGRALRPLGTKLVAHTGDPRGESRAIGAGFAAHVLKPASPSELVALIRALAGGGRPLDPANVGRDIARRQAIAHGGDPIVH